MDDIHGHGWRWVSDGHLPAPLETEGWTMLALGDPLQETHGVLADWFTRQGCHAALVRPDNYVFGTASTADEQDMLRQEWCQMLQ